MIRAVLFDLDGTVADTFPAVQEALNMMRRDFGCPPLTREETMTFFCGSLQDFGRFSIPPELSKDPLNREKAIRLYCENYAETFLHTRDCFPGITDAMERLSEHFILGLYSNKPDNYVIPLAKQLFRPGLLTIARGIRPGAPPKPEAAGTHIILNEIGVSPNECVFVGDSEIDLMTAFNAGMLPIIACWGYRGEEFMRAQGADHLMHTPDEMADFILSLRKSSRGIPVL